MTGNVTAQESLRGAGSDVTCTHEDADLTETANVASSASESAAMIADGTGSFGFLAVVADSKAEEQPSLTRLDVVKKLLASTVE